jgi:hypothetical protein
MGNKDAYTEAYEIGLRQGEAKRTDLERRLREAEADAEGFRHAMLSTEASLHTAWDERDAARRWAKRWKRVAKVKLEWGRKCKAALLKQRQRADDLAAQLRKTQRDYRLAQQAWIKDAQGWRDDLAALRAVAEAAEIYVLWPTEGARDALKAALAAARAAGALDAKKIPNLPTDGDA